MGFEGSVGGPFLKLPCLKVFRAVNISLKMARDGRKVFPVGTSAVEVLEFAGCYADDSGLQAYVMASKRLKRLVVDQNDLPASWLRSIGPEPLGAVTASVLSDLILAHQETLQDFKFRLGYQGDIDAVGAKPCLRFCGALGRLCIGSVDDINRLEGVYGENVADCLPSGLKCLFLHPRDAAPAEEEDITHLYRPIAEC